MAINRWRVAYSSSRNESAGGSGARQCLRESSAETIRIPCFLSSLFQLPFSSVQTQNSVLRELASKPVQYTVNLLLDE